MKFKMEVVRSTVMAGLAAVLLASCGGGTQIESFAPRRVIAFGDESSLIQSSKKYTVNGLVFDTDSTVTPPVSAPRQPPVFECNSNLIWVQQLANSYRFAFAECPVAGFATLNQTMQAVVDAKAASLNGQIDNFLGAAGPFASTDLVTVLVGTKDILDAAQGAADPGAAAELAGRQVGDAVVRITNLGAKVIVSTIPDVGFTPYAISREAGAPGTVAQLSNLSRLFNTALRLKLQDVRDGGRAVGLVLADEMVLSMVRNPIAFGFNVIDKPVCATAAITDCTVITLDSTAVATSYGADWLWADALHLGASAQSRLGGLAVSRARSNPF